MSELKPCPFCGDTYIIVRHSRAGYTVGCNTISCVACHVRVKPFRTENEAIEAWNRRTTIEPERKKGKWIDPGYDSIFTYVKSYAKCDQCGKVVNYGREMNFCPNCGSDMRGNQDENN